ncbi:hypothetical protein ACVC7V_17555 [Hydrogenophaga sp. A37]|uniref:hypothetical protein n=1 Tax=Hydrogenophaga sp. A37 TaxID=1945864 RepID=UPI0009874733|nr:hypothetical protein [Hydrogenophaga sp. A37]OOG79161.1 hypothetical protein B0E41_25385 [Hydrogenophaga sp. A37]
MSVIGYKFRADGSLIGFDVSMEGLESDLLPANDPAVAAVLLARERASAQRRTTVFANTIRERIASSKHYLQAARWSIQLASAQAVKAGAATAFDTAVLEREARNRELGESVEQLADKVIANSLIFASVGAAVDGIERATLDRVAACTEVAGFEAILTAAKAKALAEFLDIFTPFYGLEGAQARAAQFFSPGA